MTSKAHIKEKVQELIKLTEEDHGYFANKILEKLKILDENIDLLEEGSWEYS